MIESISFNLGAAVIALTLQDTLWKIVDALLDVVETHPSSVEAPVPMYQCMAQADHRHLSMDHGLSGPHGVFVRMLLHQSADS